MNEELAGNLTSRIAEEYEIGRTPHILLHSATSANHTVSSNDNIYNQDGFYSLNCARVVTYDGTGTELTSTTDSLSEKIDRLEKKIDKLTTMMDLKLDSKTLDLLDDLTL